MNELQTKQEQEIQAAPVSDSAAILSIIERASTDPNVDIDKMERMMAMYERMNDKKAEMAFTQAMTAAQSEMRRISADMNNNQTRSKYASYGQLDKHLRPIYTGHGFSLSFDTERSDSPDVLIVACVVSHKDGYSRRFSAPMPADGKGAKGGDVMTKTHATGAAMSYGMRYLLKMIFNVAIGEDDTDGNAQPLPKITEKQAADLLALIEEVEADKSKFCKYFKITEVSDLPQQAMQDATRMLENKRKKG